MTQHDVALRSDMSLRYYQDLEAGNKLASLLTLFRLADALGCKPEKLLGEAYKAWQSS